MASFIPLSVPNFQGNEKEYVNEAVVSEWVSTGGSKVGDFENAIAHYVATSFLHPLPRYSARSDRDPSSDCWQ